MGMCEIFFSFHIDIHFSTMPLEKIKNWRDKREEVWNNLIKCFCCAYVFKSCHGDWLYETANKLCESDQNYATIKEDTQRAEGFAKQWCSWIRLHHSSRKNRKRSTFLQFMTLMTQYQYYRRNRMWKGSECNMYVALCSHSTTS